MQCVKIKFNTLKIYSVEYGRNREISIWFLFHLYCPLKKSSSRCRSIHEKILWELPRLAGLILFSVLMVFMGQLVHLAKITLSYHYSKVCSYEFSRLLNNFIFFRKVRGLG